MVRPTRGLSMLQLVAAVAIIGILTSISLATYTQVRQRAVDDLVVVTLRSYDEQIAADLADGVLFFDAVIGVAMEPAGPDGPDLDGDGRFGPVVHVDPDGDETSSGWQLIYGQDSRCGTLSFPIGDDGQPTTDGATPIDVDICGELTFAQTVPAPVDGMVVAGGDQHAVISWNTTGDAMYELSVVPTEHDGHDGGFRIAVAGTDTFTVDGLRNNVEYTVTVVAVSPAGRSDPTDLPVMPFRLVPPPDGVTIDPDRDLVVVSWNAAAADDDVEEYVVYRDALQVATVETTSWVDPDPEPGARYEIAGLTSSGEETGWSEPVFAPADVAAAATEVVGFAASREDGDVPTTVTVRWDAVATGSSVIVQRWTQTPGSSWETVVDNDTSGEVDDPDQPDAVWYRASADDGATWTGPVIVPPVSADTGGDAGLIVTVTVDNRDTDGTVPALRARLGDDPRGTEDAAGAPVSNDATITIALPADTDRATFRLLLDGTPIVPEAPAAGGDWTDPTGGAAGTVTVRLVDVPDGDYQLTVASVAADGSAYATSPPARLYIDTVAPPLPDGMAVTFDADLDPDNVTVTWSAGPAYTLSGARLELRHRPDDQPDGWTTFTVAPTVVTGGLLTVGLPDPPPGSWCWQARAVDDGSPQGAPDDGNWTLWEDLGCVDLVSWGPWSTPTLVGTCTAVNDPTSHQRECVPVDQTRDYGGWTAGSYLASSCTATSGGTTERTCQTRTRTGSYGGWSAWSTGAWSYTSACTASSSTTFQRQCSIMIRTRSWGPVTTTSYSLTQYNSWRDTDALGFVVSYGQWQQRTRTRSWGSWSTSGWGLRNISTVNTTTRRVWCRQRWRHRTGGVWQSWSYGSWQSSGSCTGAHHSPNGQRQNQSRTSNMGAWTAWSYLGWNVWGSCTGNHRSQHGERECARRSANMQPWSSWHTYHGDSRSPTVWLPSSPTTFASCTDPHRSPHGERQCRARTASRTVDWTGWSETPNPTVGPTYTSCTASSSALSEQQCRTYTRSLPAWTQPGWPTPATPVGSCTTVDHSSTARTVCLMRERHAE